MLHLFLLALINYSHGDWHHNLYMSGGLGVNTRSELHFSSQGTNIPNGEEGQALVESNLSYFIGIGYKLRKIRFEGELIYVPHRFDEIQYDSFLDNSDTIASEFKGYLLGTTLGAWCDIETGTPVTLYGGASAGVFRHKLEVDTDAPDLLPPDIENTITSIGITVGSGLQYRPNPKLSVDLGYRLVLTTSDDSFHSTDGEHTLDCKNYRNHFITTKILFHLDEPMVP